MADTKISLLNELVAPKQGDWVAIVDTDNVETKKVNWNKFSNISAAVDVPITDSGNNYTATEVENALAEVFLAKEKIIGLPAYLGMLLTSNLSGIRSWVPRNMQTNSSGDIVYIEGYAQTNDYNIDGSVNYIETTVNSVVYRQTMVYTGYNITSIVATDQINTWDKTFTYVGNNITAESEWIKR